MSNIPVAFLVLGALFTLYVVAATWRSKDASPPVRGGTARPRARPLSVERPRSHWWRARQRSKKPV